MESFMSRYLKGEITNEEVKKHGLTQADIQNIKRSYQTLEKMLEEYKPSIWNRKDQIEKIKEELEIDSKIAELLTFLGKSYQSFINGVKWDMSKSEGPYLEKNLYFYYRQTLDFIIYLLSRQHQNYSFYTPLCMQEYGSYITAKCVNLVINENAGFKYFQFYESDKCKEYLNYLYRNQKSFIASTYVRSYDGDDYNIKTLYYENELFRNSKEVGFLGKLDHKVFCYLGDDIFREVITKLMLFSELHGLCIGDINEQNKEEYARAIESMDISSYSIELLKTYPAKFTLTRKR